MAILSKIFYLSAENETQSFKLKFVQQRKSTLRNKMHTDWLEMYLKSLFRSNFSAAATLPRDNASNVTKLFLFLILHALEHNLSSLCKTSSFVLIFNLIF